MKTVTKKVYFYKIRFFGTPMPGQTAAPLVSVNDVMTAISALPTTSKSKPSRILLPLSGVNSDSQIMIVTENLIGVKVSGFIANIQENDLPPTFDPLTGNYQFGTPIPLLHRSHFYIDVQTGIMAFQSSKSSPNVASIAYYIQEKASSIVNAVYPQVYLNADIVTTLKSKPKKALELLIHSSGVDKTRVLGSNILDSLKSLTKINNSESVGIFLSIGKYKRKGNLSIDQLVDNLGNFLVTASKDIETLLIRTDDGTINLIEQKFFLSVDFPASLFNTPNVKSIDIIQPMEAAYLANKNDISRQKI